MCSSIFSQNLESRQTEVTEEESFYKEANYRISMVLTEDHPTIDGVVEEDCWANVPAISNFTQVRPLEGSSPSEKTEIVKKFVYEL